MPKRISKTDLILASARESMGIAESDVEQARALLEKTEAVLAAYQRIYADLEKTLRGKTAPKPTAVAGATRKSREAKTSTETGKAEATTAGVCAVPNCGQPEDALIHESGEGSHLSEDRVTMISFYIPGCGNGRHELSEPLSGVLWPVRLNSDSLPKRLGTPARGFLF